MSGRVIGSLHLKRVRAGQHLDVLRGLAAFLVLIGHVRNLFFVDYGQLVAHSIFLQALYFSTSLGHYAVVIFFVLSGLLISGKVFSSAMRGDWSWRLYLIDRCTRLYIVLIPALILCASLDHLGEMLFGTNSIYGGLSLGSSVIDFSAIRRTSFSIFAGNALFLQQITVPPFGSDSPLWSLSYEYWYYLLFPLLFFVFWKAQRSDIFKPSLRQIYLVIAAVLAILIGSRLRAYFLIWLGGACIWWLPRSPGGRFNQALGLFLLLPLPLSLLFASRAQSLFNEFWADAIVGLACTIFVYGLVQDRRECAGQDLYGRASHFVAGFSYTLYLTHMPALFLLRQLFIHSEGRWQPDLLHLLGGGLIVLSVCIYAFVISLLTERHTQALKLFISSSMWRPTKVQHTSLSEPPES